MRPNSRLSSADDTETRRKHSRISSLIAVARIALFSFLKRRTERFLCGLLVFIVAQGISVAQSKPEEVVFPISGRELHGFIWKPEGTGPFPAIVWNHGSEKLPGSQPVLAKFYTAHSTATLSSTTRIHGVRGDGIAEETTSVSYLGQYEFAPIVVYCALAAERNRAALEQLRRERPD
jgi:hypothetical protein